MYNEFNKLPYIDFEDSREYFYFPMEKWDEIEELFWDITNRFKKSF